MSNSRGKGDNGWKVKRMKREKGHGGNKGIVST